MISEACTRSQKANNYIFAFAMGLAVAVAAVLSPCWWAVATGNNALPKCSPGQSDFIQFAAAARMIVNGEGSALYDVSAQRAAQLAIDPRSPHVMPFYYAPFYAAALAPLGWMSFTQAFAAMTALNIGLLILSLTILVRRLGLDSMQTKWLALAAACNMGVHYSLLQGQNSLISLVLLTLVVTDNRASAGIWSSLLFFKPSLGIAPLFALVVKRNWRAIGVAMIIGGGLAVISFLIIGFQGFTDYRSMAIRAASSQDPLQIDDYAMFNLRGLVVSLFGKSTDAVWMAGSLGIFLTGLVQLARGESWAIFVIAMVLAAPHLHGHDLALLIIPAAFFLKTHRELTPWTLFALLMFGMLPIINNIIIAPPLITIALLVVFFTMCCAKVDMIFPTHNDGRAS